MANPNPEVWGAPNTWIDDQMLYTSGYTGTTELKNIKPKTSNFTPNQPIDYRSGCLNRGVRLANVFQWGTPIDTTICPCGQDPTVSAYGKIDVYHNKKNIDQNKIPDYQNVYENENINWFFSSTNNYNQQLRYNKINIDSNVEQWAPNGVPDESDVFNNNAYIVPWTYYQVKSLLLQIMVLPINGQYAQNTTETNGAITLDEWKNNQSDKKISGVFLEILGCSGYNSQNNIIAYTGPLQGGYSEGRSIGFSLMTAVNNGSSDITDYTTFNYNKRNFIPLVSRYVRGNGFRSNEWTYIFGYHNLDNTELKFYYSEYADDGYGIYPEIGYSEHNYEQIMKMAACFGVPFTPTNKSSFNILFTDNDLYLPIIDENGVTHGEYTHGNDNLTNNLYSKDSIREYDYDPTRPPKPVDTNTYSSQTYFNQVLNLASMTRRYVLDGAAVEQLGRDLWKISDDLAHVDPADTFKNYEDLLIDNFLTNNPIDCIISLDKYPILNIPTGTQKEPIQYGKVTGAAQGRPFNTTSYFFNFEGVRIFPKFGKSFLDYEPYTHYELYVPFCDTIQIDPGDIIDRILSVIMCIDFSTGTVTAYVMADNLCINTLNGSCSINIPVTGTDGVTLNSQINNGIINTKKAQGNLFLGGFLNMFTIGGIGKLALDPTSKANQILQGSLDKAQAVYDLKHTEVPIHTIGSASPVGSWSLELTCRLIIYYPEGEAIDSSGGVSSTSPKLADLTEYGHTTGFACVMNGKVSDFHGLTVGNIDTSTISGATEEERSMIKNMFSQGVWLP